MNKFVLIDGNSLINRAFYATPLLTNSKGVPTNAVVAFLNMTIKIIKEMKPKYFLVAFDRHEPTFRHKMYQEYKGTRKPAPKELYEQIELLKRVLDSMGISRFEMPTIEADDIIGTIAKKYGKVETIIFTGDKDSFQLVDDTTSVYFTKRGISDVEIYSSENFYEKVGLLPKQIIDLKALMGDSSDNIPGVSGIGQKTALTLLEKYENVENLYSHIDEITGKLKEKLQSGVDSCALSKTLATINTAVKIEGELDDYTFEFPFKSSFKDILKELEIRNILKKEEIFQDQIICEPVNVETVLIEPSTDIMSIVKNDKITLFIDDFISFYDCRNFEYRFDTGYDLLSILSIDDALKALACLFDNKDITIITYYKNQLKHRLDELNIALKAKVIDVSLMKYLVDYTGKDEKLFDVFFSNGLNNVTPSYSLYRLYEIYNEKLNGDEFWLYKNIDEPLSDVLFNMKKAGFKVDADALLQLQEQYSQKIEKLENQIIALAGKNFNVNSPKQLSQVLFEDLKLSHGKKTKSGYSTNAEILEELAGEHKIIPLILQYRKFRKLLSTYVIGFKSLIDKKSGLIHTTFNQVHTATGRLSSREPNLQNIPIRNDDGKEIRKLFSARDDEHILIDADYSQIELRLLAHFSKSKILIDAFNEGADIHSVTASQVFGVGLSEVTKEMRASAKAVNFGIIYGISDFGLANNLKISPKKAGEYIKKYFEMYPNVKEYMQNNVSFAKSHGYATTLFNRKRYIRDINSSNYNLRSFAERVAMNMPLQGTASDIIKIAMINIDKKMSDLGLKSKLILQVHDELVIDALKSEVDIVKKILIEEMENAVSLDVKLTVSVSVCENWYDAK